MLATRSLSPSVCLPCRLRLLATVPVRRVSRVAGTWPIASTRSPSLRVCSPRRIAAAATRFQTFATLPPGDESSLAPGQAEGDEAAVEEGVALEEDVATNLREEDDTVLETQSVEVRAEEARLTFGEAVPEGWLTDEEMVVYKRLYGEPAKIVDEPPESIPEETRGNALLKADNTGAFEEVEMEVFDEHAEEEEKDAAIQDPNLRLARDIQAAMDRGLIREEGAEEMEEEYDDEDEADELMTPNLTAESSRAQPITIAGRFATNPSTLQLSSTGYIQPVTELLSNTSNKHITEAAHKHLGGPTLDYSSSVPTRNAKAPQRPIGLSASQTQMGPVDADAFLAAVMPATYASTVSALVEVRRRLGSEWIEGLMGKQGGPRVLDVGGGGAGILAWRDVIRAEWDRLQGSTAKSKREQDGAATEPPFGKSTVLTGSEVLRQRVSRLLENTSFLPRLPERINEAADTEAIDAPDAHDPNAPQQKRRRYDIIVAPHSILHLKEDWERRKHVQTLWSLLEPQGGVLVLLEKGMPRGFEAIAGARQHLLDRVIKSPGNETFVPRMDEETNFASANTSSGAEGEMSNDHDAVEKERGMILAPCTNHEVCPMYKLPGQSAGRKDFCHFNQRFYRPKFYSRVLGHEHSKSNHEDARFSYLAVQRGVDLRAGDNPAAAYDPTAQHRPSQSFTQDEAAYERAFEGVDNGRAPSTEASASPSPPQRPHPLTLPRTILHPLKRRGHIILDLCTPAGTLERWTVPKSFSRLAFRDARKARWGDLWGLGAKTRVVKSVRLGKRGDQDAQLARLETLAAARQAKKHGVPGANKQLRQAIEAAGVDGQARPDNPELQPPKTRSGLPKIKPWQRRALERAERRNAKIGKSSLHEAKRDEADEEDEDGDEEHRVWGRHGGKRRVVPGKDEAQLLEELVGDRKPKKKPASKRPANKRSANKQPGRGRMEGEWF